MGLFEEMYKDIVGLGSKAIKAILLIITILIFITLFLFYGACALHVDAIKFYWTQHMVFKFFLTITAFISCWTFLVYGIACLFRRKFSLVALFMSALSGIIWVVMVNGANVIK